MKKFTPELSPHSYDSASDFIKSLCKLAKEQGFKLGIRDLGKKMSCSPTGWITNLDITPAFLKKDNRLKILYSYFNLNALQQKEFELLLEKSVSERKKIKGEILKIRRVGSKTIKELHSESYVGPVYHTIHLLRMNGKIEKGISNKSLIELTYCYLKGFLTKKQVGKAINILMDSKIISRKENGKLITDNTFLSFPDDKAYERFKFGLQSIDRLFSEETSRAFLYWLVLSPAALEKIEKKKNEFEQYVNKIIDSDNEQNASELRIISFWDVKAISINNKKRKKP